MRNLELSIKCRRICVNLCQNNLGLHIIIYLIRVNTGILSTYNAGKERIS